MKFIGRRMKGTVEDDLVEVEECVKTGRARRADLELGDSRDGESMLGDRSPL